MHFRQIIAMCDSGDFIIFNRGGNHQRSDGRIVEDSAVCNFFHSIRYDAFFHIVYNKHQLFTVGIHQNAISKGEMCVCRVNIDGGEGIASDESATFYSFNGFADIQCGQFFAQFKCRGMDGFQSARGGETLKF